MNIKKSLFVFTICLQTMFLFHIQESSAKAGPTSKGTVRITVTIPEKPKPLVVNGQTLMVMPQFHESKSEDTLTVHGKIKVLTKIYIAE